jgi:hypothetical protein
MKEKNEPTITYKLFESYPPKSIDEKPPVSSKVAQDYAIYEAKKARENLEPARSVVDLHMEKLSDDWQHMTNFEILTMQLKEFEKWYELAVAHHLPDMIVIHGVGSGKLRDEIHEILKQKKKFVILSINMIRVLVMAQRRFSLTCKLLNPTIIISTNHSFN